jgi:hypothetical protein
MSWNDRHRETPDKVDDDLSEYGWAAVKEGLHKLGREPTAEEIRLAKIKHGSCICPFGQRDPSCTAHRCPNKEPWDPS